MQDKKELNNEELEKVNGGAPYIGTRVPTANDFVHKIDDVVNYRIFDPDYNSMFHVNFRVVGLGMIFTGSKGPLLGYNLLYKFETIDRKISKYDGWYDFDLWVTSLYIKKASTEGLIIVAEK